MKKSMIVGVVLGAVGVTAGGALAFGTYNYMQQLPPPGEAMATQAVVVAAADLQKGAELRRDDLRVILVRSIGKSFCAANATAGTSIA